MALQTLADDLFFPVRSATRKICIAVEKEIDWVGLWKSNEVDAKTIEAEYKSCLLKHGRMMLVPIDGEKASVTNLLLTKATLHEALVSSLVEYLCATSDIDVGKMVIEALVAAPASANQHLFSATARAIELFESAPIQALLVARLPSLFKSSLLPVSMLPMAIQQARQTIEEFFYEKLVKRGEMQAKAVFEALLSSHQALNRSEWRAEAIRWLRSTKDPAFLRLLAVFLLRHYAMCADEFGSCLNFSSL